MLARYYTSRAGRFLSVDPVGNSDAALPQAWNKFTYARSNPIKYVDPDGRAPTSRYLVPDDATLAPNASARRWIADKLARIPVAGPTIAGVVDRVLAPFMPGSQGEFVAMAKFAPFALGMPMVVGGGAGASAIPGAATEQGAAAGGATRAVGEATGPGLNAPDFVVTQRGEAITVPTGATGPYPTEGAGFQYKGGSGGPGLDPQVSNVRIMDPTLPRGPSPGYPGGYVSYSNVGGQTVNPFTGQTVPPTDPMWHMPLLP